MTVKTVSVFACALLLSASAEAQLKCRTIVVPEQHNNFHTAVSIPPSVIGEQLTYPVIYTVPANAVSVGLEFWASRFQLGLPFDSVAIHGYHILPDGTRTLTVPLNNMGTPDDYKWKAFAMSTVMHAGEQWVLGVFNGNRFPVTVDLAITIRECVA